MKQKHNYIAIFSILFTIFFSFGLLDAKNTDETSVISAELTKNTVISSSTQIVTPLIIDGFATGLNANNWSKAIHDGWVTGQGTSTDPYLINNIKVDTDNLGNALTIQNSKNVFFVINNSKFIAGDDYSAIELINSANGTITNSIFAESKYGVFLNGGSLQNTISKNTIIENEYGIYFGFMTMANMIMGNGISNNEILGVFAETSASNNMISMNYFQRNPIHAKDNSSMGNIWNLTMMGNFWDDYTGEDNDTDSIGDDPYSITGDIQDFLPIFNHDPMIIPIMNHSYVIESTDNIVNWTVLDMFSFDASYRIFQNGELIATGDDWTPGEIIIDIDGLEIGTYNFTLIVSDGLGGVNSNQINVSVVNTNNMLYVFIGIIVIFVGILLFINNRKG
ncbi:NosD domain-containing protein [Candidatus Lokiarchaeum ossiferum]|uniref:NosD domain-containing protein n=1 Tax=Candidatus Lokiarchaeum ossiferum TaxID=2951803 RepID=UPI00352DACF0